jgi:protein TonB
MFEQAVLAAPPSHRLFGAFAGVTCQAILVGSLILAPMLFPQMLPDVHSMVSLVAPGPPPAPPAPGPVVRPKSMVTATRRVCILCAPVAIPKNIAIVVDDPPEIASGPGVVGMEGFGVGPGGGTGPSVLGSILKDMSTIVPAPPVAQVVTPKLVPIVPAKPQQIVGGMVKMANPIHRVEPAYPVIARQARVSGTVEIEAVIAVDGHLREIHVKGGPPLLVKAAVDAVKQWVYEPTTLNGVPVEVVGVILVTFRLN